VFLKGRMPGVSFENLTELHEVKNMLEQRVIEWTEEWFKQGEAKGEAKGEARGRQKGRQEGEAALLQRLLERRYGPLSEPQRLRLQTADADTLLRWGERIFQAASVDEVLSDAAEK
jgi:predicted transposase YdaD